MARTKENAERRRELKRKAEKEFDAVCECVRSMAWHGFQNREMFLQNVDELREHLDKMAELYKEL